MNFQPKLKEVEMKNMVKNICAAMVISLCAAGHLSATENNPNNDNKFMEENLNLIQEWDKTFPQSDKVNHKKITFLQPLRHYTYCRFVCTQECDG